MGGNRFTVNPFQALTLSAHDREELVEIAQTLVLAKFHEYQEYLRTKKHVDLSRWKNYRQEGATITYLERKKSNPDARLPALLMVGPLPGSLEDNMFGIVSPTLEAVQIKSSYLEDVHDAAVLATIVEPTLEDPFRSVLVKWMEVNIPLSAFGLVHNRDYVYLESTGLFTLENGERVGYHLLHSLSFPQTHVLPNRVRGNMSLCGMFRQEAPDKTDCRGTGLMDPGGDMIRLLAIPGIVAATMSGLKYSHCGQMKKLAWRLEQRYAEAKEHGVPAFKPVCVTCSTAIKRRKLGEFGQANSTCKLCFGALCTSCTVAKKLSFVALDLELTQRKVTFCARCLMEAMRINTEEAARVQFVYKTYTKSSILSWGSSELST